MPLHRCGHTAAAAPRPESIPAPDRAFRGRAVTHRPGTALAWSVVLALAALPGRAAPPVAAAAVTPSPVPAPTRAATEADADAIRLRAEFVAPPRSARPLVWWHWMNGNISKEGIRLDLEWMDRAGLGGYQLFDAARSTPQIVARRMPYMSPAWKDAFGYASTLARQHGFEQSIASSPGWSLTGGPWVAPADGMKKYVWSETSVPGGQPFAGKLAQPPANPGPFQGRPLPANVLPGAAAPVSQPLYVDTRVIAVRQPGDAAPTPRPHIDASDAALEPAALADGDHGTTARLAIPPAGGTAWIRYTYAAPVTLRAISLATNDPLPLLTSLYGTPVPTIALEASDDGTTWRSIVRLPSRNTPQSTVAFAPATARYFRVSFLSGQKGQPSEFFQGVDAAQYGYIAEPKLTHYEINELALHREDRLDRFEVKAGFGADVAEPAPPGSVPAGPVATRADVIDISAHMAPDGLLRWTPPPGRWTVLRFGYSLVGKTNHPAALEATGLEVDKLDGDAVRRYLAAYLDEYQAIPGVRLGAGGIGHLVVDSWEAGVQNWTPALLQAFKQRRGYAAEPWLPVLTGRVIESAAQSERFLWDFRATLGDLVAEQHFGVLQQALQARGMDQYVESHEGGRAFIGDGMRAKQFGEIPMSAMWARDPATPWRPSSYSLDIRESASVAHIDGRQVVAAESFTANVKPFDWSPTRLKKTADLEFLDGVNRVVIHSSVHQPLVGADTAPGLTLGPFGQWFNRNETWAEQARPWTDYLARTSYLLQQGRFVADVLSFYGENTNVTRAARAIPAAVPAGYAYDFVDPYTVIHRLTVDDQGRIATPCGMRYRVLHLGGEHRWMTSAMLKAVQRLVEQGATVVGAKPLQTPTLADDPAAFKALASAVFGDASGAVRTLGKGRLYVDGTVAQALATLGVAPDFESGAAAADAGIGYVHRKLNDGDLYFVANQGMAAVTIDARFRVAGREPQLWHADSGTIEPVSYRISGGHTVVPLTLAPGGSVFVVFLSPAAQQQRLVQPPVKRTVATLAGPWHLAFPADRGAPPSVVLDRLQSWSEHGNPGVRYFSGTGTYSSTLQVQPAWLRPGARLWLNLGNVNNLASVSVNGREIGTVWLAPFQLDITSAVRAGTNELKVSVTNAWVNRLVGDAQPGTVRRYTSSTYLPYGADAPLVPSGLLGPVTLLVSEAPAPLAAAIP